MMNDQRHARLQSLKTGSWITQQPSRVVVTNPRTKACSPRRPPTLPVSTLYPVTGHFYSEASELFIPSPDRTLHWKPDWCHGGAGRSPWRDQMISFSLGRRREGVCGQIRIINAGSWEKTNNPQQILTFLMWLSGVNSNNLIIIIWL